MKKLKLIMVILLLFMLSFTLSSCTPDSKEIDDQVYTLVVGADKAVDNKIRVTVQFPTYKGGGGEGGSQKKSSSGDGGNNITGEVGGTLIQTVEASSLLEALNLLNTSTSRRISLVQTKDIIFSEELAKEGIGRYMEPIARFRETRRSMQLIVCRGTAEDYIKENKTLIGESLAKAMELMTIQSKNTGYFPHVSFNQFYTRMLDPYSMPFAAYAGLNDFSKLKPLNGSSKSPLNTEYDVLPGEEPRKGDLAREIFGTALFDGDKMIGSLNSYETRYFLMITGNFKTGIITIPEPENSDLAIPLDVRLGRKPNIRVHFENEIPVIDVDLNIECDLGAIQSREDYEKMSKINDLNHYVETIIKSGVENTIKKTQDEYHVDIFGFGGYAARRFITVTDFEKYNWLSHYRDAKVNVKVSVNIRRTGLMTESSAIRNSEKTIISDKEN